MFETLNALFVVKKEAQNGTQWAVTQRVIPNFEVFLLPAFTALKSVDKRWNATSQGKLVSNGLCLGFDNNSDSNDAVLSIDSCDEKEKGQFWSFATNLPTIPTPRPIRFPSQVSYQLASGSVHRYFNELFLK